MLSDSGHPGPRPTGAHKARVKNGNPAIFCGDLLNIQGILAALDEGQNPRKFLQRVRGGLCRVD